MNRMNKDLVDFEKIKNKIFPALINTDANRDKLNDLIHNEIMDLSITYNVLSHTSAYNVLSHTLEDDVIMTPITKDYLNAWCITEETLHSTSLQNLLFSNEVQCKTINFGEFDPNFVAITSNVMVNGAAYMLSNTVMNQYASQMGGDVFIIPSSIHEIIMIKNDGARDVKELQEMIKEANDVIVSPNEILSYNIYQFKDMTLEIAKPKMPELEKADEGRKLSQTSETSKNIDTDKSFT